MEGISRLLSLSEFPAMPQAKNIAAVREVSPWPRFLYFPLHAGGRQELLATIADAPWGKTLAAGFLFPAASTCFRSAIECPRGCGFSSNPCSAHDPGRGSRGHRRTAAVRRRACRERGVNGRILAQTMGARI